MRLRRVIAPTVPALALVLVAAVAGMAAAPTPNVRSIARGTRAVEVRRIRVHFDSVLRELDGRDLSALGVTQRANRGTLVGTLRAYRNRGAFPHNYDFPGAAVPYLVDRGTGTLCAVAHLLASTGRSDIVARVALADNNVRVAQLAGDTAFRQWLDDNGLTLAEAGRIQVPYVETPPVAATPSRTRIPVAVPVAVGASVFAATWNAFANSDGHSRLANAAGFGSGLAAFGIGASQMGRQNVPQAVSVLAAAAGAMSVALSARSVHRHNVIAAAKRDAGRRSGVASATIAPMLPAGGSGAGVSVSMRF